MMITSRYVFYKIQSKGFPKVYVDMLFACTVLVFLTIIVHSVPVLLV